MSIGTGRGRLEEARKDLLRNWDRAKHSWHDPVSRDFEERVIVKFDRRIKGTTPNIDQTRLCLTAAWAQLHSTSYPRDGPGGLRHIE